MPPKTNPAKLNPLQLRTLTLLQLIARLPNAAVQRPDGHVEIKKLPEAHGNHFHLGDAMVNGADATGLHIEAVWNALARKGLAEADYPHHLALTPDGLNYDTGDTKAILHQGDH